MKLVRAKEGYRKVGDKYLLAKKCTVCGRWLVASTVNFSRAKNGRYGLNSQCKECRNKYDKQYRENNKEKIAEKNKRYRENNKDKIVEYRKANKDKIAEYKKQYYQDNKERLDKINKQYRENNKDNIAEYKKQYYQDNKEKIAEHKKQYRKENKEKISKQRKQRYEANKDKILEQQKQYCEANKEKILERKKQYREDNKEKLAEYRKQYYEANRNKVLEQQKQYMQTPQGQVARFNAHNKRRHKKEAQGTGATGDQWLEMMQYFDFRCAYTGERLTKKTRSTDHIVAIDAGGDDMIWNMVPMTRFLNCSKQAKDMLEWYKGQSFYSEARLAKIYEWQEYAYNKWGKDTEYFNTNDIQITLL